VRREAQGMRRKGSKREQGAGTAGGREQGAGGYGFSGGIYHP